MTNEEKYKTQEERRDALIAFCKNKATMISFDAHHASRICKHYAHAIEKHPYFCDIIKTVAVPFDFAGWCLEDCRERLIHARDANVLKWDDLLDCKKYEAMAEINHENTARAVEECYDAISVLLRTIDVLEGRQKLGKPQPKGETK